MSSSGLKNKNVQEQTGRAGDSTGEALCSCVISVDLSKGGWGGRMGNTFASSRMSAEQSRSVQRLSSSVHEADWLCVITKAGGGFINH